MGLHVAPNVFYREIQGFVVILDLETAGYYILDPVGSSMWKTLLAVNDDADALQALLNNYSVERARLKADLKAFTRRCIEQGFLREEATEQRPQIPLCDAAGQRNFLIPRAWWCLFRTVRALSIKGLSQTYQEYARLPVPLMKAGDLDEALNRLVDAFAMAENFFLIKNAPRDCLPRSLALFRFLRSAGIPVEHCIGVRRFPFQAHAWVEYRGRVVQDNPNRQSIFSTLTRIPA